jgi:hypothetical protein
LCNPEALKLKSLGLELKGDMNKIFFPSLEEQQEAENNVDWKAESIPDRTGCRKSSGTNRRP